VLVKLLLLRRNHCHPLTNPPTHQNTPEPGTWWPSTTT
jgi:hypothetical protein